MRERCSIPACYSGGKLAKSKHRPRYCATQRNRDFSGLRPSAQLVWGVVRDFTRGRVPCAREFLISAQGTAERRHAAKELAGPSGGALDPGPVVRVLRNPQGTAERRHAAKELAGPSGGALDPGPVVRVLRNPQGTAERRHAAKELAGPSGGALDPGPVVRVLRNPQGTAERRHAAKELAGPSGGALDPGPFVRVSLKRVVPALLASASKERLERPGRSDT